MLPPCLGTGFFGMDTGKELAVEVVAEFRGLPIGEGFVDELLHLNQVAAVFARYEMASVGTRSFGVEGCGAIAEEQFFLFVVV